MLTFNGKPFKAKDFEREMKRRVKEVVANELRERIGSIRDPETGEFPIVAARGNKLEDMRISVEASPKLIAIIRDRLQLKDVGMVDFTEAKRSSDPKAFISYASEDRDLAEHIARALIEAGVETWWDQWEIRAGDSIVEKINKGLGNCTHFIVLLSPNSINKIWVLTENEAAFIRKVNGEVKFIPLRNNLSAKQLLPLMSILHSPTISDPPDEKEIDQLVSDIYGLTKKPELGRKPAAANQPASLYSAAAMAVAEYFCRETKDAVFMDPQVSEKNLAEAVDLSLEDTRDALYELRDFFRENHLAVVPEKYLWAEFDKYFPYGADPFADALTIAADMVNTQDFPEALEEIADRYGWSPRRLNPAVAYLLGKDLVRDIHYLGSGVWVTSQISRTDATRRFVKNRS